MIYNMLQHTHALLQVIGVNAYYILSQERVKPKLSVAP